MPSSESPKNRRFMEQADQRRRVVARLLALLTLVSGGYYLVWAFRALNPAYPVIGAIFLAAEICSLALFAVATTGVWRLRFKPETGLAIEHPWTVDVLVPTYGEPIETLRATLEAASRIRWTGALTVYVLDDAGSADVEALAAEWGCRYLSRRRAGVPQRDAKAGNLNFGLAHATGDLVLVLDADQRAFPQILEALAGYMRFERVAFVQSQQSFTVPQEDPFYSNDRVFYEAVQLGLDGGDAAISCGSGVLYRRAALDDIGGFATWNLLEDLTTSYTLHAAGWKSFYYPHALSVGLAPTDIWGVYQQRGQWAFDTMRLILWDNPLFKRSLGWFPRVTYLIIGLSYLCAAFVFPFFFLIPIWSYLTGGNVLNRPELEFALVRSAYFVCMTLAMQFLFRFRQPGKQFQMLTGLFPIYARGIVRAFFYQKGRKPEYRPNNRPRQRPVRPRALAVLPQLLVLAGNGLLPFYATVSGRVPGRLIAANIAISTLAIWSLLPVVLAALRHGGTSRVVAAESAGLVRPHRLGRTVLVSAWLIVTVGFLWVQQPGFWRSPYLRYEQARQLEAAGQTADAIAEVGRAVADDPANAGYRSYKGYLELAAGRAPEAERSFRDAEALAPAVPDVQLGLAESLGLQGRQAEVRARLTGLDASTLTEAQRYRRSEALAAAGDFAGAVSDRALIDGLAGVERLSAALAWSMAAQDWPLAVSLADRILDTRTTDALRLHTLRQQGVALRALDRPEEALAAFEQAPDAENLRTRTELLLQLGRFDDAVPRLEELAAADASVDVHGQL
ncbi:MAG: glycosyltransferase, partial [Acidobacteria bacterium]|nr:glycosyltransferase [Acidobacteriota bacterium]